MIVFGWFFFLGFDFFKLVCRFMLGWGGERLLEVWLIGSNKLVFLVRKFGSILKG